jgi:hypothetical protein
MMKVKIDAFVCYEQPCIWGEGKHGFQIQMYDPSDVNSTRNVLVFPQTFEVEIPENFDPRPQMVKSLEAEKEKARKDFAYKVMEIDRKINELLALEHTA